MILPSTTSAITPGRQQTSLHSLRVKFSLLVAITGICVFSPAAEFPQPVSRRVPRTRHLRVAARNGARRGEVRAYILPRLILPKIAIGLFDHFVYVLGFLLP